MSGKTSFATENLVRLQSRDECLASKFEKLEVDDPVDSVDLSGDPEAVNHPDHYQADGYEVLDVIEDFELNFNLGNVIKYVLRAGRKDPELKKQDLEKALFYLTREVGD